MNTGTKFDAGKPRYDLIDPWALDDVAKVLTQGAEEHGDYNWRVVPNACERYSAALHRHFAAYRMNEHIDSKSGFHHMAHIICNAMFLHYFWRFNNDLHVISGSHARDLTANREASRADKHGSTNDAEKIRTDTEQHIQGVIEFLGKRRALLGARTYRLHTLGDGGVEIILSTNNETSTYVSHIGIATLHQLCRLANYSLSKP